ncbi:hypothetical protein APHAL10511_000967 [Amanita phalloides]|nr:hypothetical protein APHAL10511_000967 [Amanita phalloides]
MDGDSVWVTAGPHAIKYIRGKEVLRITNPLQKTLSFMVIFGAQILALAEDGSRMFSWNTTTAVLDSAIEFDPGFTAISILHPATYVNKVLVASSEGDLHLWNIRSQTCVYKFQASKLLALPSAHRSNDLNSALTALTQSPAIDVVGVGFTCGNIVIYDIRADERLMRMFMEGGSVRALGFRTDGQPILASASSSGHIAIWDLNGGGRLLHMIRGAHDGGISFIEWIPGQPVLVSSADDNSVKQWFFESPTAAPRLLKYRSGHHAPPHLIRYYGEDGKQLLTASRDRSLRCMSVVRDSRSTELSQGSLARKATSLSIPVASLKFPPVTDISYSLARAKDWDDILSAHADEPFARTWSMLNKRLGKHTFGFVDDIKGKRKERLPLGSVKSVCVTACGNFGIASSSTGSIYMWNMQSGLRRKSYDVGPCPPDAANGAFSSGSKRRERCITGLATDALNRILIVSTLDGTVNFFDFQTTMLEQTLVLPSAAVSLTLHRDNGLLAVICDDMIVRIIDIETRRIVREFGGIYSRILDITFSSNSRWLITSSLDSVIRTFDIPTGRLIDAFRTTSVATSISFSPTGDFLATAHIDSVGVYLWANRAQFAEVAFHTVSDEDIQEVSLPTMQSITDEDIVAGLSALTTQSALVDVFSTPPQLDGELVTLTLLPRSRWQTLLNLEVIQQRNKPKEPPKAPEKAPFFLPTLPGVEARFSVQPQGEHKQETRRLEKATAHVDSVFSKKLLAESVDDDYDDFFRHVKTLSPAALDLELRSLVSLECMNAFINALTQRLLSHRDFEAVQTLQTVFLRMHGDALIENTESGEKLERLAVVQREESQRVLGLVASSLGTLGFVRDVQ